MSDDNETKDEGREMVAMIFDSAAQFASSLSVMGGPVGAALKIGSGIAAVIGTLIRSVGVDETKEAIADLVKRKHEGIITDAHVARDDDEIAAAVSAMFAGGKE